MRIWPLANKVVIMTKRRPRHYLSDRDKDVLIFLWQFKVATTSMLHCRFFSNITRRATYSVLHRLRKHSYIEVITNKNGKMPIWTLQKPGFEMAKAYMLNDLKVDGFKSENPEHDLLCSSIHLGEFLKQIPKGITLVSEQMLRTYQPEFLPNWVPDVEEHRPDGYWYFKNATEIKLISLEVEINNKAFVRYKGYSNFYDKFSSTTRVLWIIKSQSQARQILKAMYKYKPKYKIHNFVILKDILKNGWNAEIYAGVDRGKTINDLIYMEEQFSTDLERVTYFNQLLLDRRVSFRNNKDSDFSDNSSNSDCMGVS